ncbi:MAG: METTL5 family protein [Methanobacterium sp.]|nr:METTL5 family protein [Methanobacterium sp.]
MMIKKRHLEIVLQSIPTFNNPRADLEQYKTPAIIAADILWNAHVLGDIGGLKVVDLGCGTGIFSIGAALLGAREVVGVDIDQSAIEIARKEASSRDMDEVATFVVNDILEFNDKGDTVIQNPPFGAQKTHHKEADRNFIEKSMEVAPVVYSFHIAETLDFVTEYFKINGGQITHTFKYKFPIPRTYEFHVKEKVMVHVVVVRVQKE